VVANSISNIFRTGGAELLTIVSLFGHMLIKQIKIMANNYSQISMHIVFAVRYRESLILPEFRPTLFKYIYGIIEGKQQKSLAVNGVADHVHIFAGLEPTVYIPDFVRDLKSDSSYFINSHSLSPRKFHWQTGYGVFSHSRSCRDKVIQYILHQEERHKKQTFKSEYIGLLEKMGIEYEPRYLFDFFEI
jgi:REP element-mobilizing transposase RayT